MAIEPWRTTHPLESAIRKIRRAEKHVEAINQLIATWEALEPNGVRRVLSADQTLYEYSIWAAYPPFLDIGIALGEFAYQLRSALDQVVFAMCKFPASLTPDDLERAE